MSGDFRNVSPVVAFPVTPSDSLVINALALRIVNKGDLWLTVAVVSGANNITLDIPPSCVVYENMPVSKVLAAGTSTDTNLRIVGLA